MAVMFVANVDTVLISHTLLISDDERHLISMSSEYITLGFHDIYLYYLVFL
jgi:hypothetical protein